MANDTHGVQVAGWYGFDLDGTLAVYDGWKGIDHIGDPVVPMVQLARRMHEAGYRIKVVTARVSPRPLPETRPNPYIKNHWCVQDPDVQTWALESDWGAREFVQEWCYRNLGFVPGVTHEKDYAMLQLFDDRCVQVEANTGRVLGRLPDELARFGESGPANVMTLAEAIDHARDVAARRRGLCDACGFNHEQLAIWLEDYRRMLVEGIDYA